MLEGVPAVITGIPNAGKSSLLNALLGYDRAIVTNIPGTTRDTIEEKLSFGGVTLRLTDTAGVRAGGDEIEKLGVERSRRAMESAELAIAVADGSREISAGDLEIIRAAAAVPHCVVVLSKLDLGAVPQPLIPAGLPVVRVSSVTGQGTDELEMVIAAMVRSMPPTVGKSLALVSGSESVR